jgi:hypothetical protein
LLRVNNYLALFPNIFLFEIFRIVLVGRMVLGR